LTAINAGFNITNQYSINTSNPNGIFNLTHSKIYNNTTTSTSSLQIDLTKVFTNSSYYIDLSGSYLYNTLGVGKGVFGTTGIEGMRIDLSTNSVFTGTILQNQASYTFPTDGIIMKVYPSGVLIDNSNAEPFNIAPNSYEPVDIILFSQRVSQSIQGFTDILDNTKPFSSSSFNMVIDQVTGAVTSTLSIKINKYLTQNNYKLIFVDPSSNGDPSYNSWSTNLKFTDLSYSLSDYSLPEQSYCEISGNSNISGYTYTITEPTKIILKGVNPGVVTTTEANDITINIPAAPSPNYTYTLQQIYSIINAEFNKDENKIANGSTISTITIGKKNYVNIRLNINKTYTENDYRLVFYDPYSFAKCISGINSSRNATWDSTLGWILGFRKKTEYDLSLFDNELIVDNITSVEITGDTSVSTNLYSYFLIMLNDYTQSHLNDGLITLTPQQTSIALPSYANRTTFQCDTNGKKTFTGALSNIPGNGNTQNQIYSVNQIVAGNENQPKTYSNGPYIQDIFGLIPIKSGNNGATYVEFGGTLQNQNRTYFGPVNLKRMSIQLITDRGDPVDLNGQNWSFSFICEQLYEQNSTY
jgi:hypothetical protein